ncbi:aspartate aminotransferase family protein [Oscillochloris sp. ZM17-4]|uniref:aspartate aminotransferase family protein n=1 Tax=Oscillochloris sp. ZM17-4 TaxID=2866714 RepID=UPI001C733EF4|nr:aspartate aminotransferase family protein [Oscillochloris sp. ZM17-4]MBX0326773.1 aspartate aminotransferase family protein [Oscillochloris sp. ZM17-4]
MAADTTEAVVQADREYILQTYARPDFVFERGEGVYLYDTDGKQYLDFVAGIAVNALGYGDPDVTEAIAAQAAKLIHVSNLYHTAPGGELARMLVESSPAFDKVFFSNSGAEAIEGAIKFARRYAREHFGEGKTTIVAFDGSFHGRTMGAVAVTAREKYREPFMPVMPGVRFADYNDLASLEAAMGDDVCAVLLEPIQGEGGLRVADESFLKAARALCDRHHALLIFDEIQCGMGRTGTLWGHEPSGVRPDMMTVAKPLAGGLPIGAVLLNQRIADTIHAGDHGTTFGGNPLSTAVAGVVLRKISDPDFLAHVRQVSSYLDESLQDLAADMPGTVLELRGRGLMRGIRIAGSAGAIREAAHSHGLLVATAGDDVIRLLPPLVIDTQHIDAAVAALREVLR